MAYSPSFTLSCSIYKARDLDYISKVPANSRYCQLPSETGRSHVLSCRDFWKRVVVNWESLRGAACLLFSAQNNSHSLPSLSGIFCLFLETWLRPYHEPSVCGVRGWESQEFSRAAITKYHKQSHLTNRNCLRSGGWKLKIEGSAGLAPSARENLFPAPDELLLVHW